MVKVGTATFIERDEKILKKSFNLKVFQFKRKSWGFLFSSILFWFWLFKNIWNADLLFARFINYHSFLLSLAGKIFKKKVVVVVGGSDAIWIPRFHYGIYDFWFSRLIAKWTIHMVDLLLPNHYSLIKGINTYSDDTPRKEGILEYNPDIKTKILEINNGYDYNYWKPDPTIKKINAVLTVANANDIKVFYTKGLDYYIKTASLLPQYKFFLVGVERHFINEVIKLEIPQNLILLNTMKSDKLRKLYNKIKVFAHFTLTEGMPNVLCEAMLCECIPVGSNVNSIPDIIGNTGIIIYKRDIFEMKNAIIKAMKMNTGKEARKRIIEKYPEEKRELELTKTLNNLLED